MLQSIKLHGTLFNVSWKCIQYHCAYINSKVPFEIVELRRKIQPFLHSKNRIFEANKCPLKRLNLKNESSWSPSPCTCICTLWWVLFKLFLQFIFSLFEKIYVMRLYQLRLPEGWRIDNALHVSLELLYYKWHTRGYTVWRTARIKRIGWNLSFQTDFGTYRQKP